MPTDLAKPAPEMPYGSWPSPLTAELIVERASSVGEVVAGLDDAWWSEMRPSEGGRVAIVRHRPGGQLVDVLPEGFSARTGVHEYGGGAWWLHDDALFFVNGPDQRLYRLDAGAAPRPLTPEPPHPGSARFADGRVTADGRWVVCVRELHHDDGTEPSNELVAVPAHDGGEPVVIVTGPDFVSDPRPSPDGRKLCWLQWDHPNMPWDGTQLWVADLADDRDAISLTNPRRIAGGPDESIFQPSWMPGGDLLFVSDRSGWWNLYRVAAGEVGLGSETSLPVPRPLGPVDADIGTPQWVFGMSRYAPLADGRILVALTKAGIDHLGVVDADGLTLTQIPTRYTSWSSLRSFGGGALALAGSPDREPEIVVLDVPADPREAGLAALRPARDLGIAPEWFSLPEPITFPTSPGADGADGATAHALFYRPTNPRARGPEGEAPPLVVISHGGPTSSARPQLNLTIQYWTSRGLAVVDVNYRGSSGFGRAYRRMLDGRWGIDDVEDCAAAARHLAARGEADPERLAIRGSSAGGLTTLSALTSRDDFAAGASLYGISDLEALARDTHKFESRYLDGLVGPYPEERATYEARSPIHHADRLSCPLIVFQGSEDAVVPPSQAESMVRVLRDKGIPFSYLLFEGEQHGFRQASSILRVLTAELYFYGRVLGFTPADELEPIPIEGL